MLKINLLPPYIYEKRKVRRTAFLFGFVFLIAVGVMLGWWTYLGNKQRELQIQVADMTQKANEVRALEQQIQAERNKLPTIQGRVSFIESLLEYNLKAPRLYEELAKYTYNRIQYRSVEISGGNQLNIQAHAGSVGDCGRYLLNMYRASHIFSSVTIDAIPGWPSQQATDTTGAGFDIRVSCTLVENIAAPTFGGAPTEGGVPGMPVGPGAPAAPAAPTGQGAPQPIGVATPRLQPGQY